MGVKASEQQAQQEPVVEAFDFTVGATHYRYTSYYQEQTLGGSLFEAEAIEKNDDSVLGDGLDAGSCEVSLPATNALAEALKASRETRAVGLTVTKYFADDLTESSVTFAGDLVGVSFADGLCKMKFESYMHLLDCDVPKVVVQAGCNNRLFDDVCAINSDLYKEVVAPTVSNQGRTLTSATFGGHADGYYDGGRVYFPTTGEYRYVTAHAGNAITLHYAIPTLTSGATVHVWPGCDKKPATCVDKFNNIGQFVGFPYVPTKDTRNAITNE